MLCRRGRTENIILHTTQAKMHELVGDSSARGRSSKMAELKALAHESGRKAETAAQTLLREAEERLNMLHRSRMRV